MNDFIIKTDRGFLESISNYDGEAEYTDNWRLARVFHEDWDFSDNWEKIPLVELWFEEHDKEYLKFEMIPEEDRFHPSYSLCGLLKLASLMKDPSSFSFQGEHDEIYLPGLDELKSLAEGDVIYLRRCGVHWDKSVCCFSMFT